MLRSATLNDYVWNQVYKHSNVDMDDIKAQAKSTQDAICPLIAEVNSLADDVANTTTLAEAKKAGDLRLVALQRLVDTTLLEIAKATDAAVRDGGEADTSDGMGSEGLGNDGHKMVIDSLGDGGDLNDDDVD